MKVQTIRYPLVGLCGVMAVVVVGFFSVVSAERFTGGSYIIDASVVGNSFGGSSTGGSYKLTSSGGESIIGQGSGGSYKLNSGYVAQLPRSMQLTVQPGSLVGYFPLGQVIENGATMYNEASSTASNMLATGQPGVAAGKVGNASTFDLTSKFYKETAASSIYNIGTTGALTYELWFKASSSTSPQYLGFKEGNCRGWYMSLTPGAGGGKVYAHFGDALTGCSDDTEYPLTSPLAYIDNAWHHTAMVIDRAADTMSLYVDGSEVASRADLTTTQSGVGGIFRIGTNSSEIEFVNGSLDEVKLFNRALSAEEIKAEYDAGNAGKTAGLGLGSITPGTSDTAPYDAIVQTDAFGYTLAVHQNQNLTKGVDTISGISGSIASPVSWSEGTTKGLGFTLISSNATAIDGKWNAGASYAAFPGSATSIYTRSGQPVTASKDVLNMRLRLDVTSSQPPGTYTNVMTTTATYTP